MFNLYDKIKVQIYIDFLSSNINLFWWTHYSLKKFDFLFFALLDFANGSLFKIFICKSKILFKK